MVTPQPGKPLKKDVGEKMKYINFIIGLLWYINKALE
jgi:hypothetical protein